MVKILQNCVTLILNSPQQPLYMFHSSVNRIIQHLNNLLLSLGYPQQSLPLHPLHAQVDSIHQEVWNVQNLTGIADPMPPHHWEEELFLQDTKITPTPQPKPQAVTQNQPDTFQEAEFQLLHTSHPDTLWGLWTRGISRELWHTCKKLCRSTCSTKSKLLYTVAQKLLEPRVVRPWMVTSSNITNPLRETQLK